jgi:integrase
MENLAWRMPYCLGGRLCRRERNPRWRQFETRREAEAFRIEVEGHIRGGTFRPEAGRITVAAVAELFLEHCETRMRRRERMTRHNLAVYRGHLKNHVLDVEHGVGALKLAQLTARGVNDFRDRLRSAGVSVVTTRKILATLHSMLNFAIGRDLIAVNAASGVKVIGRRDEGARKIVAPSKNALCRVLDAAGPELRLRVVFAAATGLRAGEFHAVRWRHLDLDKGEVSVETRVDAYGQEDVTKTAAGMRTVPIGAPVVRLLKEWRLRSRFSRPDDLVFPNRRGGHTWSSAISCRRVSGPRSPA